MSIYQTTACGNSENLKLDLKAKNKPDMVVTPPAEFGGIDTEWSPEDLFCASISSCFILTFKFIARTKKLNWENIVVEVDATLEKKDGGLKFTKVLIKPKLTVCCSQTVDAYLEALVRAKDSCLVTNSMSCEFEVKPKIIVKAK
ncbi:MAG: organic hydroperoxide reductase OsmC/OhrA [Bacteriovoracaceae bacterium]|jgi:organic hydroperoxide reductase OsmC/OhrA